MAKKQKLDLATVQVYQVLFTMGMQLILTIAGIVAFFMVLFKIFDAQTFFDAGKLTLIEFMLGGSIFMAYKFFFPPVSVKEATNAAQATVEST